MTLPTEELFGRAILWLLPFAIYKLNRPRSGVT